MNKHEFRQAIETGKVIQGRGYKYSKLNEVYRANSCNVELVKTTFEDLWLWVANYEGLFLPPEDTKKKPMSENEINISARINSVETHTSADVYPIKIGGPVKTKVTLEFVTGEKVESLRDYIMTECDIIIKKKE